MELADRLHRRVWIDPDTGCWVWQGNTDRNGYGRIKVEGRQDYAHRVSYRLRHGHIPSGKEIDHLCRNRSCCCPDHLEAVLHRTNVERGFHSTLFRSDGTCAAGLHDITTPGTTYSAGRKRLCRLCRLASNRAARSRRRTT